MKRPALGQRPAALAIAVLTLMLLAGAAALLQAHQRHLAPPPRTARQPLMLLTSLPLVFGERFGLQSGGSKTLTALETRYTVVPIAVADLGILKQARILLMAHAPAQPAENLVALDGWVRNGGKLLLLADPALEWESQRALGDPLRPLPMFPERGLLAHWGLRLDRPKLGGEARREVGGRMVVTRSPGQLSGSCTISADGFLADCNIGRGRAIVLADADFLNVDALEGGAENLDGLLVALAQLESG